MSDYWSHLPLAGIILLVIALLGELLRLWRRNTQAFKALRQPSVKAVSVSLAGLLYNGSDGAWIRISESTRGRFVQFRKQYDSDGRGRIEAIFPRAAWSESYYDSIRRLLEGLDVEIERVALREEDAPVEYLRADFGQDVQKGAVFVIRAFREVFSRLPERFHLETDRYWEAAPGPSSHHR